MRKICAVVGSRANYSSTKSAMREIQAHPDLELELVVVASALLDRAARNISKNSLLREEDLGVD